MSWSGSAIVYGAPQAMGSKRAFYIKKIKRAVVVDTKDKKLRTFQEGVRESMRETAPEMPILGPIAISLEMVLPRPQGHFGTGRNAGILKQSAPSLCITKPDGDKVLRACLDCGTGIWYRDDSQVCVYDGLVKRYAREGEEAHTRIDAREVVE